MKRAALYVRVSTVDQHPETQLHELRTFAAQRGLQIVGEYTDHGFSGIRARRPELDRMMEAARRHRFDVLLVWSCDRLARSTKHLLQTLDELSGYWSGASSSSASGQACAGRSWRVGRWGVRGSMSTESRSSMIAARGCR